MQVFTDGSTINNGKKNAYGGLAVYVPSMNYQLSYSLISTDKIKVTNQVAELIAVILGIEYAIKHSPEIIYIYTDSKYTIDCATNWCKSWLKNNWKKSNGKVIDNLWLIYRLIQLTKKHPVIFKHIRSHQTEPENKQSNEYKLWYGNNMADVLAGQCSTNVQTNASAKILKWDNLASLILSGMKKDIKIFLPIINELQKFYKDNFNINICPEQSNDSSNDSANDLQNNSDKNNSNKNNNKVNCDRVIDI